MLLRWEAVLIFHHTVNGFFLLSCRPLQLLLSYCGAASLIVAHLAQSFGLDRHLLLCMLFLLFWEDELKNSPSNVYVHFLPWSFWFCFFSHWWSLTNLYSLNTAAILKCDRYFRHFLKPFFEKFKEFPIHFTVLHYFYWFIKPNLNKMHWNVRF